MSGLQNTKTNSNNKRIIGKKTSRVEIVKLDSNNNNNSKKQSPYGVLVEKKSSSRESRDKIVQQPVLPNIENNHVEPTNANITFEIGSGNENAFESVLRRDAISTIVQREHYILQLRRLIRVHPSNTHGEVPEEPIEKTLADLFQKIRETTLNTITKIIRWENVFVHPQELFYGGPHQEPVNYLSAISVLPRMMRKHPVILSTLEELFGSIDVAQRVIESPLLNDPLKFEFLEKEAMQCLRRNETNFGALDENYEVCSWCGITPFQSDKLGQVLVRCTGDYCDRSRYCQFCVQTNCGGKFAYRDIAKSSSWHCFVCTYQTSLIARQEREAELERTRKIHQRKREQERRHLENQRKIRANSKANRKRRSMALKYIRTRATDAKRKFEAKRQATVRLIQLGSQIKRQVDRHNEAKEWLIRKAFSALQELQDLREDYKQHASGSLSKAAKYHLQKSFAMSSLDICEIEAPQTTEKCEPWEVPGALVNLRFALRAIPSEICFIRAKSTERNPDIVELGVFAPSRGQIIDTLFVHKSFLNMKKRNFQLLAILRNRTNVILQNEARKSLLEFAPLAHKWFAHYRVQYIQSTALQAFGSRVTAQTNLCAESFQYLQQFGAKVTMHLEQKREARAFCRDLVNRYRMQEKQHALARRTLQQRAKQFIVHIQQQREAKLALHAIARNYQIDILLLK